MVFAIEILHGVPCVVKKRLNRSKYGVWWGENGMKVGLNWGVIANRGVMLERLEDFFLSKRIFFYFLWKYVFLAITFSKKKWLRLIFNEVFSLSPGTNWRSTIANTEGVVTKPAPAHRGRVTRQLAAADCHAYCKSSTYVLVYLVTGPGVGLLSGVCHEQPGVAHKTVEAA